MSKLDEILDKVDARGYQVRIAKSEIKQLFLELIDNLYKEGEFVSDDDGTEGIVYTALKEKVKEL